MADDRHFEKPLNRYNSATVRLIAMKFGMSTHFDPPKPGDGQKYDFTNQDGRRLMVEHVRGQYAQSESATYRIGTTWMPIGAHVGATWRIQLNRPCAAAIQPCVKLL